MHITARQAYIDILTELVKEESPTLYLEDYLYYFNKAISEYMKTRYELFEVNQQLSDDLRVWKKTFLAPSLSTPTKDIFKMVSVNGAQTRVNEYRHLLSCLIDIKVNRPISKCDQRPNTTIRYKVTRMSSSIKAGIVDNSYLRPEFYRPYFEMTDDAIKIDVGDINTKWIEISNITIEYLMQPTYVDLTEEEVEADEDTSQVLEFSKDVGEEIVKVALKLILERGTDPRLQSHVAVNQSISDMSTGYKGGK